MKKFSPVFLIICLVVLGSVAVAFDEIFFDIVNLNKVKFLTSNQTRAVSMIGPATLSANWQMTLPTSAGSSGQFLRTDGAGVTTWVTPAGGGTVTSFSFTNANGITGVVTNPTTTPNLTLTLGAITPTSVTASGNITSTGGNLAASAGNISASGSITSSGSSVVASIGNLVAGTAGSSTGSLILNNATGANSTTLQAGASAPSLTYILPTVAPTVNQFLVAAAPSGVNVQTSWVSTIGGYQGQNAYDVVRDYNASGSAQTTTGSVSNGSTALTVASAIDFAVNQGIFISGAGASGANYTGSITNISGTAITISPAASTTVVTVLVQHDDTVAWQSAFTAMQAAGSKNILAKAGTYRWNPAIVNASCNALVCLPQVTRTAASGPYTIGIYGEDSTPSLGASTVPTTGVIIDSQQFAGAVTNFSAQLAAKTYVVTGTITTNEFNYVQVIISGITFRNKPNPALTAIQMNNAEGLQLYNVNADNGEALTFTTAAGFNTLTQPTNANAIGIITPGINNIGNQWLQNTWVTGYNIGYMTSDNQRFQGTYAIQDGTCYRFHSGPAQQTGTIGAYECTTLVDAISDVAGPVGASIDLRGQMEGYTGAPWWSTPNGQRVVDASNLLAGNINAMQNGTSAIGRAGITGGAQLSFLDAFNGNFDLRDTNANLTIAQTDSSGPVNIGQLTLANSGGARLFFYVAGSAYGVSKFRGNGVIGTDGDLYLNPATAKNVWLTFNNTDTFEFTSGGVFELLSDNGGAVPNFSIARNANLLTLEGGSAGFAFYNSAGSNINAILDDAGQFQTLNTGGFSFVAGGTPFGGSVDTRLARFAANTGEIDDGAACSTASHCVDLTLRHSLANGTACTIGSGFGTGAAFVDGSCRDDSFRIGVGTTPGTTGVVTFGTAYTNKPSCFANDESTVVALQTVATTTQVTVNGVFVNSDVVSVTCRGRR